MTKPCREDQERNPITGRCVLKCKDGTPGIFSHRINISDNQICIGASDKYISVCRKHYMELKNINININSNFL